MQHKRASIWVGVVVVALAVVNAQAITVTYTADNVVGSWYQNGGSPISLATGGNFDNWQIADMATVALGPGTYNLIWQVSNLPGSGSGNPAGFLAEIVGAGDPVSSSSWWVSTDQGPFKDFGPGSVTWVAATEYGTNGGANIWTGANGGPVAGISTAANWIWTRDNSGSAKPEPILVRVELKVGVPESGVTLSMLGIALLGIAGMRKLL